MIKLRFWEKTEVLSKILPKVDQKSTSMGGQSLHYQINLLYEQYYECNHWLIMKECSELNPKSEYFTSNICSYFCETLVCKL